MRTLLLLLVLALFACGGKDAKTPGEEVVDLDADPIALLPGSAIALAAVDVKAMYESNSVGGQIAQLAEKLVPIGEEAHFSPQKDVDRVTAGAYAGAGLEVSAIVTGRFDEERIKKAAQNSTMTKAGAPIVATEYAGRTIYTVANTGFAILTAKTAVAGTDGGIRRVLEKIKDKRVGRTFPKWMTETVETKNAQLAFAADFGQPIASATIGSMDAAFVKGMKTARVLGNFKEPGMNFAATLGYGEPAQAEAAADWIKTATGWMKLLSAFLAIPQVKDLEVKTQGTDLQGKFSVDDKGLKSILSMVPTWLGR
jgi:hypothetical protein